MSNLRVGDKVRLRPPSYEESNKLPNGSNDHKLRCMDNVTVYTIKSIVAVDTPHFNFEIKLNEIFGTEDWCEGEFWTYIEQFVIPVTPDVTDKVHNSLLGRMVQLEPADDVWST